MNLTHTGAGCVRHAFLEPEDQSQLTCGNLVCKPAKKLSTACPGGYHSIILLRWFICRPAPQDKQSQKPLQVAMFLDHMPTLKSPSSLLQV